MNKSVLTLTILFIFLHITLFAQREIKGTVYEKDTRKPLVGASILLFTVNKSILKAQSLSDETGHFLIHNPPMGEYMLIISFMGFEALHLPVSLTEKKQTVTFDYKQLARNSIVLSGIDIKVNKPLIAIRKDTIEFSASDFQTADNASLQNLMQKVPGLTMDMEGNFFFQGKPIKDLYVDGRPIFQNSPNGSGDPKKIAQVLMANMIDKIQVADKKGMDGLIDPGKNEKVINITIKKEMKKGVNGAAGAGYGTDGRYNTGANANMFRDNKQVIVMANSNNANTSRNPFSTDEATNLNENNPGINTATNIDGSASFDLTKKTKVNFNLFRLSNKANSDESHQRENILPDSNFRYNSTTQKETRLNGTAGYVDLEMQPDEKNKIGIGVNITSSNSHSSSQNKYITLGGSHNDTINTGRIINTDNGNNRRINFSTQYTHQFKKQGRALNASFRFEQSATDNDQNNYSLNNTKAAVSDTINQLVKPRLGYKMFSANVSYVEPLSKILSLNTSYNFTNTTIDNNQQAFDYDNIKNGYNIINKGLTFSFKNTNQVQSVSTGLEMNKGKIQSMVSLSYNINNSTSKNFTNGVNYQQKINYFSPTFSLSYKIDNYKDLRVSLISMPTIPERSSLMPVVSTENPLYIQLGNPDLKPGYQNQLFIDYRSFSIKGLTFGASLIGMLQDNAVSTSVYSDSTGHQVSKPVNVSGTYSFLPNLSIGKRFAKSALTLNYNIALYLNRNINYVNKIKNATTNYTLNNSFSGSWMYKKLLEFNAMALIQYNGNRYSIQNNAYYDFIDYKIYLSVNSYLPLNINVGTAAIYNSNTSLQQQFTLLNGWISKTFLHDKSLLAKLYAYDLLRENKSLKSALAPTYLERAQFTVLSQYFMLSMTYFFGKKGPKQPGEAQ